jgi:hypothetical protein
METEGNICCVTTSSEERIRNLNVIQDFNNKKANSHATIFVASMFSLFTVLSLSQRIVAKEFPSFLCWNTLVLALSLVSYGLIWLFGLYSFLNFSYYSTVAQRAEEQLVQDLDRKLISHYKSKWTGILKRFASFKVPNTDDDGTGQGTFRRNNEAISVLFYFIIGFLPLLAFLISLKVSL